MISLCKHTLCTNNQLIPSNRHIVIANQHSLPLAVLQEITKIHVGVFNSQLIISTISGANLLPAEDGETYTDDSFGNSIIHFTSDLLQ